MGSRLDMTMMFAVHEALRRDLVRVARIAASTDDAPARRLQTVAGWELFKKFLVVHHTSEDQAIWPTLQERVAGKPDQAAVVDAMEAEHAAIDPLLTAVDAAAADPDYGHQSSATWWTPGHRADRAPAARGERRPGADRRHADRGGVEALLRRAPRGDRRGPGALPALAARRRDRRRQGGPARRLPARHPGALPRRVEPGLRRAAAVGPELPVHRLRPAARLQERNVHARQGAGGTRRRGAARRRSATWAWPCW